MRARHALTRAVVGALVAGVLGLVPATVSNAKEGDAQQRVKFTGSISSIAGTLSAPMELSLPAGTVPVSLTGTLEGPAGRSVDLLVGDRIALPVKAMPTSGRLPVKVPVTAADVSARGAMTVRLRQGEIDPHAVCEHRTGAVMMFEPALLVTGTEQPPTSLAKFFPAVSPRTTVVVAPTATDDVLTAGLSAVAALSRRYPQSHIVMSTTAPSTAELGERAVVIEHADQPLTSQVVMKGLPTLTISGHGEELRRATDALDSQVVPFGDSAVTRGLSAMRESIPAALEQTLSDLGQPRVSLGGYGTSSYYIGVPQASFGRSVASMKVHLVGTHSALPKDAAGTVDVRWNDLLIASTDLTQSRDVFTIDADVPSSAMQGENGLKVEVHAVPVGGRCERDYDAIPFSVDFDGRRSTVTAQAGVGETVGFQRFPQVLGGVLPIAVRGEGPDKVKEAVRAASVVSALQQASRPPLQVSLLSPDALMAGHQSGLLVGASGEDTNRLAAPLRLFGMRLLHTRSEQDAVGTDQPYGALQAFASDKRDVLVMGGWGPTPGSAAPLLDRLSNRLTETRWNRLSGDVYLSNANVLPFTLTAQDIFAQPQEVQESRSWVWWGVLAVLVLALALTARTVIARRRQREISAYVTAQEGFTGAHASNAPGVDAASKPEA